MVKRCLAVSVLVSIGVILIHITAGGAITLNAAAAWQKLTGPWNVDCEGSFAAIAIHPTNPDVIYIGSSHLTKGCGIYKSIDGGKTWNPKNDGLHQIGLGPLKHYPAISKIVIAPSNPNVLYVGTYTEDPILGPVGYIYRSTNAGNTWVDACGRSNWLGIRQIQKGVLDLSVDPTNPNTVFAGLSVQGVYKTTNGGMDWTEVKSGSITGQVDHYHIVRSVTSSIVYIAGGQKYSDVPCIPVPVSPGAISCSGSLPLGPFKSVNGGDKESWININTPERVFLSDFLIHPSNPNILYFSTIAAGILVGPIPILIDNHGIFKSVTGGNTWQAINNALGEDLSSIPIYDLEIDPSSPDRLYAAAGFNGIFQSLDGGNSWESLSGPQEVSFIGKIYASAGELYALTAAGLYVYNAYTKPPEPKPVITSPLRILQSSPYYVGDTITASFAITNKGSAPITLEVLTVGGRDPDDQVQDFDWHRSITLNPDDSYNYQGNLTLSKVGNYHFFCAYRTPDGNWNTSIDLASGLTDEDRTEDITVIELVPSIISHGLTPMTAKPGDTLTINYTINNPTSETIPIGLGCSIQRAGTITWINDTSNDIVVNVSPGSGNYSRKFVLPSTLDWGTYNIRWGILYASFTTSYDLKQSNNALTVNTPPTLDDIPPIVVLGLPNGGEDWAVSSRQTIRWNATDDVGVDHINIQFSSNEGASWSNIVTGIANSGRYAWTVPDNGSTLCRVKIIAYDAAGNFGFDESDGNFTISAAGTKLPAPTLHNPVISGRNYNLSWSSVSGANSYILQEDTNSSFSSSVEYNLNQTSRYFSDKGSGTYYYRVCAVNEQGRGTWSNTKSVVIAGRQWPGEITNRFPPDGATDQPLTVTLSWTSTHPAGESTKYNVWFATADLTYFYSHHLVSSQQTATTYTAHNLPYNTTCSWKIDAIDETGDERTSPILHFTTIADNSPPTGSIVINNGGATTVSFAVILTLSATDTQSDVRSMALSNDGVNWKGFSYQKQCSWNLSDYHYGGNSSNGIKTVYAKFEDTSGNISSIYTDTIEKITGTPGNIILNDGYYETIMDAMDAAQSGDIIYLTEGVYTMIGKLYKPPIYPGYAGVIMKPGVTLMGAGAKNTKLILESGIYTIVDADNAIIQGLTIINSEPGGGRTAVFLGSNSSKIRYCIIENTDTGMKVHKYDGTINNEISNNVIRNNGTGIEVGDENVEIYNNTIVYNNSSGIVGGENGVVKNNIIGFNNNGVVVIPNTVFQYNNVFGNGYNYQTTEGWLKDQTGINGNISSDPRFVNASARDYRLGAGSPCIDAGTNVGIPASGSPDMGAFEYNGTATIRVESNRSDAAFAITGPQTFTGSGTNWAVSNAPIGIYSITFTPIANHNIPRYTSKILESGQTLTFDGNYYPDKEPPEVSIAINHDEYATADRFVDITLSASDKVAGLGTGAQMQFSNNGSTWSPVEPYSTLRRYWDLGVYGGDLTSGVKTVYVRVSDALGNFTTDIITDTILYAPNREILLEVPAQYSTIQAAIDAAQAGDMVWVAPGTYQEGVVLKEGIRLQGSGPALTILDRYGSYTITAADNCVIDGFTINKSGGFISILCNNASPIISNNIIYGAKPVSVSGNSRPRIRNNILIRGSMGVLISGEAGGGAIIENNTIVNSGDAIYLMGATPNTRIYLYNNIIANSVGYGIVDGNGDTDHKHIFCSFNTFWNNAGGNFGGTNRDNVYSVEDIEADPMFVDPGNEDFGLRTNSPCIDTGNAEERYNDPDGTRNDRGAYGGPGWNTVPRADFRINSEIGGIRAVFTFNATVSSDRETESDKLAVRWDWENDGIFDTGFSKDKVVTYSYGTPGEKTIAMQVMDEGGFVSSISKKVTILNQPPTTPSNPDPSDGSTVHLMNPQLRWSAGDPDPGDPVKYDIYLGTSGTLSLVDSAITDTIYNPGTLERSCFYFWQIVAIDNHGAQTTGSLWSFATEPEPLPEAPDSLIVVSVSSDRVKLHWKDNSENEIGFKIERRIDEGVSIQIYTVGSNVTTYSDTGLAEGTTYHYRARAYNASGNSEYSDIVSATTPLLDILGDVDNSRVVNVTDALIVATCELDPSITIPDGGKIELGDVNGDDMINIADALMIATYDLNPENAYLPPGIAQPISLAKFVAGAFLTEGLYPKGSIVVKLSPSKAKPSLGETMAIAITIDMAQVEEKLGAYSAILRWNPEVLEYAGYEGGNTEGFDRPLVMEGEVDKGRLKFNQFNPEGASGEVNIINVTFVVKGEFADHSLEIELSSLTAAHSFLDLLPYTKVSVAQEMSSSIPESFSLSQSYPNPFNAITTIRYSIPAQPLDEDQPVFGHKRQDGSIPVVLKIYNIRGQLVRSLVNEEKGPGRHVVRWDGCNNQGIKVGSGLYIYRLQAGNFREAKKMVMIQ